MIEWMFKLQLKRLGLIQTFQFTFEIEISVFRNMLNANLEDSPIGGIADRVDHIENSNYMYKGTVQDNYFRIKRMNNFSSRNHTLITGTLFGEDSETHVEAEFNTLRTSRFSLWFATLFIMLLIVFTIWNENYGSLFYIGIFGILGVISWIFVSKREINEMVSQFESDMLYLIRSQKSNKRQHEI